MPNWEVSRPAIRNSVRAFPPSRFVRLPPDAPGIDYDLIVQSGTVRVAEVAVVDQQGDHLGFFQRRRQRIKAGVFQRPEGGWKIIRMGFDNDHLAPEVPGHRRRYGDG